MQEARKSGETRGELRVDYRDMSDEELLFLVQKRAYDLGITEVNDSNRETVIAFLILLDNKEEVID